VSAATRTGLGWLVRLVTAAGLGVDAGIHLKLAPTQPPAGASGQLSQIDLFYAEGAAAILAALLVVILAARWAYTIAVLVAASALGAVLLYRYVDVGALGPLPNMYEPFWYASKTATTIAEAVGLVAAALGLLTASRTARSRTAGRPAAATARRR
jgi:hypothetical protein